jgi:ATPase subunit of ABC transporter with duplicated ATPase domains
MDMLVRDALHQVSNEVTDQQVFKVAGMFLLTGDLLKNPIYSLSEGQK